MAATVDSGSFLSPRAAVLREAEDAVCGDRDKSYGPPYKGLEQTAGMLNALGFRIGAMPIRAHHVAIIFAAIKLSRLMWSPNKRDSWVDLAGYAACGYECVVEERN